MEVVSYYDDIIQRSTVQTVTTLLNFYFSVIILPFGIFFNGLASFVFNRAKLNRTTMGFLYGNLAVIDSISMLTGIVLVQFLPSLNIFVMYESDLVCKLGQFTLRVVQNLSSWIQVLISLDRYINVCFPNQFVFMRKRSTLTLIIAGLALLILLINIENLFFNVVISTETFNTNTHSFNSTTNQTSVVTVQAMVKKCAGDPTIQFASDFVTALMRVWIPFGLMAFFSWRSTRQLWLSKKRILRTDALKRERQFSLTVMLFNLLFFSFNSPLSISLILTNVSSYSPQLSTVEAQQALELFQTVSFSFSYLYQSMTFFINFLFNKIFRHEVQTIIQTIFKQSSNSKHKQHQQQHSPKQLTKQ